MKKAYRRKALELHPDRNYGDVENATAKFAEVQSAYEVLSDPQERTWYDSHRESILRGDAGGMEDSFEHNAHMTSAGDIVGLIAKFNRSVPFTDAPHGFYGSLRETFENLAAEEDAACDWVGVEAMEYPGFGSAEDSFEDVVKDFYRIWINFSTKKSFSWRDAYRTSDAPDRATRRIIEKENKRLRDEGIREFNDAVRSLVAFARKRDPRYVQNAQSEADRQKILRDAAAAQAARSRAANQAKFQAHVIPDWARSQEDEEGAAEFTESEESEVEHIECVVCGKTFKSEKQYETHEKSKKHTKAVQQLRREMRKENKLLNLDTPTTGSTPSSPIPELENLKVDTRDNEVESAVSQVNGPVDVPPSDDGHESEVASPDVLVGHSIAMEAHVKSTPDSISISSEIDDEYAPREDVESRFQSLSGADPAQTDLSVDPASGTDSGNHSNVQPKLGKAKAKRAKKAAKDAKELDGENEVIVPPDLTQASVLTQSSISVWHVLSRLPQRQSCLIISKSITMLNLYQRLAKERVRDNTYIAKVGHWPYCTGNGRFDRA